MSLELRPYQREAVDSIYNYFRSGKNGNCLITAPTGSGKSLLIAKFMEEVLKRWPKQRILMLAHRKELLQQNYSKLIQMWPNAPAGIYSAGLNSKVLHKSITIAGIASIFRKAENLGWIDLILVDECHLIPSGADGDGMYRTVISKLLKINPALKVIGFTATPYRMKTGMLTDSGGIFTDVAYEIDVGRLVKEGFLSPLTSKISRTQADLSHVTVGGGEYVAAEAEAVMDDDDLTQAAISEMEKYLVNRKSWIIFCSGIEHAAHVTKSLNERGHTAECVIGETEDTFRAASLQKFKTGQIKCLVNVDVLTTGFDAPNIDALVLLRPTKSVGLYVQICGRGMRLSPGKTDCLVLDFAGNIERHGPIDAIRIQRKAGGSGKEVSVAPVKTCPNCQIAIAISVMMCPDCGYVFPVKPIHEAEASTKSIMVTVEPPKLYEVTAVNYRKHEKAGKMPSLRVIYTLKSEGGGNLGVKQVSEWICLQHSGYAYEKAVSWWVESHRAHETPDNIDVPVTIEEALTRTGELRPVQAVYVQPDGKFDRIVSRTLGEISTVPQVEQEKDVKEEKSEADYIWEKYGLNI